MQEKPDIPDQVILSCLQTEYGLDCRGVEFLPLGADVNTAVYRAESASGQGYFVKLRRGDFTEITVTLPHFLKSSGIHAIIAPLETSSRRLW
ncbi:MAG: aminoglycoside phosphotransferase family protein, partial [Chloroflexi bacterium]|nr:aminoglycoside phosphotransferase family protein [Chloroflexota bacterium]